MIEFPILTMLVLVPAIGSALVAIASKRHPDLVKVIALGSKRLWNALCYGERQDLTRHRSRARCRRNPVGGVFRKQ